MKAGPGRPPIPIAVRIAEGTYNPKIHGINLPSEGVPEMPSDLSGDARELWELIVPSLSRHEIAGRIDAPQLRIVCEFWAEYRRVMKKVQQLDVSDKNYGKLLFTAGTANANFQGAAAKFGLSPSDRAKLGLELREKQSTVGVQPRKRES